jgi:hypothetical protein
MTAEAIATVVADLRAGRVRCLDPELPQVDLAGDAPIVDATGIYEALVGRDAPVAMYEDHPCIAPPWDQAAICYVNGHGNVIVMVSTVLAAPRWETAEPTDWERVRWQLHTLLFLGGRGGAGPMPTTGPVHAWQFAIGHDGEPLDLHWIQLSPQYPTEHWDMAHLTLLGALNFLNCRNVELVEPRRPRAEARRLARTGVRVHTINVFPAGRSSRSAKTDPVGVPLTSVRGHFARYGPEYGRGLLFGKYAGRFWIPQFARGSAEHGTTDHDYALHPSPP